jgi:hypothetical protein
LKRAVLVSVSGATLRSCIARFFPFKLTLTATLSFPFFFVSMDPVQSNFFDFPGVSMIQWPSKFDVPNIYINPRN